MKLLLLFGNSAVGKMTVGQELTKITPLRLMHNHHMIEPVLEIFGQFRGDIIQKLRFTILEEFVKTDNYGLIFTYMMAFDMPSEYAYIQRVKDSLGVKEEDVYYVELVAPQDVRVMRNRTENRLREKPSKRDCDHAEGLIYRLEEKYRCVSEPGEVPYDNYLRLDNSQLSPEEAAEIIAQHFGYERR